MPLLNDMKSSTSAGTPTVFSTFVTLPPTCFGEMEQGPVGERARCHLMQRPHAALLHPPSKSNVETSFNGVEQVKIRSCSGVSTTQKETLNGNKSRSNN
jgi:hypothetical protein